MAARSGDLPSGEWGGGRDKIALQLGYAPENSLRALVIVKTRWVEDNVAFSGSGRWHSGYEY